jgi:hypothetical protein
VVGGHRISDTTVQNYLTAKATPVSDGQGGTLIPRQLVLQTLIRNKLFDAALAKTSGGQPSASELAAAKQAALQGQTDDALQGALTQAGISPTFEPVYVQSAELLQVLGNRVGAQSDQDILNAIDKADQSISVSTRYGSWDESTLGLGAAKTPDFLKGVSTPAASQPATSG